MRTNIPRLANADVATLIEQLAALASPGQPGPCSLATVTRDGALARARTCYDHHGGLELPREKSLHDLGGRGGRGLAFGVSRVLWAHSLASRWWPGEARIRSG